MEGINICNKITVKHTKDENKQVSDTYEINNCTVIISRAVIEIKGKQEDVINTLQHSSIKTNEEHNLYERFILLKSVNSNNLNENIAIYDNKFKEQYRIKIIIKYIDSYWCIAEDSRG